MPEPSPRKFTACRSARWVTERKWARHGIPQVWLLALALCAAQVGAAPALSPHHPDQGMLLVATEQLQDPFFGRAVVLLTQHGADGTMGVILNKRMRMEVSPSLGTHAGLERRLCFGGPLLPHSVVALVRADLTSGGGHQVISGTRILFGPSKIHDALERLPEDARVQVYAGHAGWAPGQLAREIARGDWLVIPAGEEDIFTDEPDDLWPRLFKRWHGQWT